MLDLKTIEDLKQQIIKVFNKNLISFYYEKIEPDFLKERNTINLLIILNEISLQEFDLFAKELSKFNNASKKITFIPKIFTFDELKTSVDVFPIEFLELQEKSELLYGEDTLKTIIVNIANLRNECEFYLRSHLLKLREAYLTPNRNLTKLIQDSYPSFIIIFKHILRIFNNICVKNNQEIIKSLANRINFKSELFSEILVNLNKTKLDNYFPFYLDGLQQIVKQVDQL